MEDVAKHRTRLEEELARLQALRDEVVAEHGADASESEQLGELSSFDQHQADVASEVFEREKDYSIILQLEDEIGEVRAAIARIDDGTYGRCERCGGDISAERLEAIPWTRFCVAHSQEAEVGMEPTGSAARSRDDGVDVTSGESDEDLVEIRAMLDESDRIDATRIQLSSAGDAILLRGSVATADEAKAAEILVSEYAGDVINELRIDRGLREGIVEPVAAERATPPSDEVLVGDVEMLAGPDAAVTDDLSVALEENEPWNPPDEPSLAPTAAEYGGELSFGDGGPLDEDEASVGDDAGVAAADLSHEELTAAADGATVPSVDPERVAPDATDAREPRSVDAFGYAPPEGVDAMVERVPGTSGGHGAMAESTEGGGSIGSVAATETGATGADTAAADPARAGTGGSMTDSGTSRGPEAKDDPAIREDFPQDSDSS